MTHADERKLLRAVERAQRRDGWFCHVRQQIPAAGAVRVYAGLATLISQGLVTETSGAYNMAVYRLTLAGRDRLGRRRRRS